MKRTFLPHLVVAAVLSGFYACATAGGGSTASSTSGTPGTGGMGGATGSGGSTVATGGDDGGFTFDVSNEDPVLDPDAACATATEEAQAVALPVDIIWMVDNSASMAVAIAEVQAGLNTFAALIGSKSLDYRVIMLSLRGKVVQGSLHPVCIPPPLAGDDNCGNGPNFFQSSVNIFSTQPLEQFLGTLAQTNGYQQGAPSGKGGEPWAQVLRPDATKTIVVVTDDNARLSATQFETFPGGQNPFNSLTLPPGILDPSWNGLFDGYIFDGLYGWGSDADPGIKCTYPNNTQPPSPGPTYTELVNKTGGVRAKICDGQAAWAPFFDAIAQAVFDTTKLSCTLDIPVPSTGVLDPLKVNVAIGDGGPPTLLVHVETAADCGNDAAWYYDDPMAPTQVILCPAACDQANLLVGPGKTGHIDVQFGCQTILK